MWGDIRIAIVLSELASHPPFSSCDSNRVPTGPGGQASGGGVRRAKCRHNRLELVTGHLGRAGDGRPESARSIDAARPVTPGQALRAPGVAREGPMALLALRRVRHRNEGQRCSANC